MKDTATFFPPMLGCFATMGNVMDTVGCENPVTDKITERGGTVDGLSFAASGMKGWRNTMEDCHTLCTELKVGGKILKEHRVFAVYDGHGGDFTSNYAGSHFVRILSQSTDLKRYASLRSAGIKGRTDVNGIELLKSALQDTFCTIDSELRDEQMRRNREKFKASITAEIRLERSGATCVVVLITPSHILCANAGDSRAMLRRNGRVLPLSFDHKPANLPEFERVVDAGGFVRNKRVNGDLAVSRGLGDFAFKNDKVLPHDKQRVTCVADILVYPRDVKSDEFIVLACDGVWDVMGNEECGTIIQEMFDEREGDVGLVCEEVLDVSLAKNSRDNMTIVLVCLPGVRMERKSFNQRHVVWNRRALRQAKVVENDAKVVAQDAFEGVGFNVNLGGKAKVAPLTLKRARTPKAAQAKTSGTPNEAGAVGLKSTDTPQKVEAGYSEEVDL